MRRLSLSVLGALVLALVLVPKDVQAQSCQFGQNFTPVTFASEKITVSSTALGFTTATVAPSGSPPASYVFCSNETDAIRFLTTGNAPTAAIGTYVAAGSYIAVCAQDISRFRAIRVTTDATLNCLYMRAPQ